MSTRSLVLSLLGLCLLGALALGVKDIWKTREQARQVEQARAELARFTHGPRQITSVNGQSTYLEVPPVNGAIQRSLANESDEQGASETSQQRKPAAQNRER